MPHGKLLPWNEGFQKVVQVMVTHWKAKRDVWDKRYIPPGK